MGVHGNSEHSGIPGCRAKKVIAQAVEYRNAVHILNILKDMGMGSDDEIRTGLRQFFCFRGLVPIGVGHFLRSPMGIDYAEICLFFRLADLVTEPGSIQHTEYAGIVLPRFPGVRILISLDLSRVENSDCRSVRDAICRLGRVIDVPARADIRDLLLIKGVKSIHCALLAVIIDVIVGESCYIRSHLSQPFRRPRRTPESKSFAGGGSSPVCVGKFVVDHQKIRSGERIPGLIVETGSDPV